tara:strand:+ start:3302 stop:3589 length:288 start_codon:yes stop_codon:yes gene_type:complete
MNVKLVRITTGEDIICDLVEEADDTVTFANPIVAVPSGNGQIGFAPWSPLLSKDVKELTINKKFVMYISETQEQMVTEYESMFSPIITPNKNLSL